ncbi:MAG: NAD(P)H-dependent oxidoreductase, partial [Deltaproteobacteria bacterium]|nr:NAD(P)H-dependent oxidoreductase [Deltaproteobacteria bacterium]
MARILIVYHSQTGNTEEMARMVAQGAASIENTEVTMKETADASLEDLLTCDGIAIGTPENFGYMSGAIKDFFDRTFYPAEGKVFRKPYVVFISAGNDGTGALNSIERIALGYQFKKVYDPVIARGTQGGVTDEILARCRELGQTIAGGIEAG